MLLQWMLNEECTLVVIIGTGFSTNITGKENDSINMVGNSHFYVENYTDSMKIRKQEKPAIVVMIWAWTLLPIRHTKTRRT